MDGWNTILSFWGIFRGPAVSFRKGIYIYIHIGAGRVGQLYIPHPMNDKRSVFVGNKINIEVWNDYIYTLGTNISPPTGMFESMIFRTHPVWWDMDDRSLDTVYILCYINIYIYTYISTVLKAEENPANNWGAIVSLLIDSKPLFPVESDG